MEAPLAPAHGTRVYRGTPVGNHCSRPLKAPFSLNAIGTMPILSYPVLLNSFCYCKSFHFFPHLFHMAFLNLMMASDGIHFEEGANNLADNVRHFALLQSVSPI